MVEMELPTKFGLDIQPAVSEKFEFTDGRLRHVSSSANKSSRAKNDVWRSRFLKLKIGL